MKEINLPPFYVGQKVVAVKVGAAGILIKGKEYVVIGIKPSVCKCEGWDVNVGIKKIAPFIGCSNCDTHGIFNDTDYAWFIHKRFAPIEENFQSISLEKVIEEETKLIGVN